MATKWQPRFFKSIVLVRCFAIRYYFFLSRKKLRTFWCTQNFHTAKIANEHFLYKKVHKLLPHFVLLIIDKIIYSMYNYISFYMTDGLCALTQMECKRTLSTVWANYSKGCGLLIFIFKEIFYEARKLERFYWRHLAG